MAIEYIKKGPNENNKRRRRALWRWALIEAEETEEQMKTRTLKLLNEVIAKAATLLAHKDQT